MAAFSTLFNLSITVLGASARTLLNNQSLNSTNWSQPPLDRSELTKSVVAAHADARDMVILTQIRSEKTVAGNGSVGSLRGTAVTWAGEHQFSLISIEFMSAGGHPVADTRI